MMNDNFYLTLHQVVLDLTDPVGWTCIPLSSSDTDLPPGPLRAHLLQLQILAMHQNGRDTHLRQVCLCPQLHIHI